MRRLWIVVTALGLVACGDDSDQPSNPGELPLAPSAGWTVDGFVRSGGQSVSGVIVQLLEDRRGSRSTETNDSGYFRFGDVAGRAQLRFQHEQYLPASRFFEVRGDQRFDITMTALVETVNFTLGDLVHGVINSFDAPCDPVHWDAQAPCARLRFQVPTSGELTVQVTDFSVFDLDFTVMTIDGSYLAFSTEDGYALRASLAVTPGFYEIWVHSYSGGASFAVRADITR
jgi:carboxypeptidase family protein